MITGFTNAKHSKDLIRENAQALANRCLQHSHNSSTYDTGKPQKCWHNLPLTDTTLVWCFYKLAVNQTLHQTLKFLPGRPFPLRGSTMSFLLSTAQVSNTHSQRQEATWQVW
ncbi:UNVERIFIED_CONTAM: hypothetical protein K2H54_063005 [Gekko kuhli]